MVVVLYSIGIIGTCCVLLAEVIGKYLDQFALRQGKGFSCFIQLEGNTDDLHALINQLNKNILKFRSNTRSMITETEKSPVNFMVN